MISTLKTPGVYVNEIDGFPPSVAQVATAIPAFVGYTEFGPKAPTKIRSLLEYQQKFGAAPEPASITVDVDNEEYTVTESEFKTYNSLRLFYANGGGECYIVSIGNYSESNFTTETNFNLAIDTLDKVDEVTLILIPDAINLSVTNLGKVQSHALKQCAELMDRFTIMDVIQEDSAGNSLDSDSTKFRDAIGNQNLKYGASYYPYLKTGFPYKFRLKQIEAGGENFKIRYAGDAAIKSNLENFDELYNDINKNPDGILFDWKKAVTDNPKVTIGVDETKVEDYLNAMWGLLGALGKSDTDNVNAGLKVHINGIIPITLKRHAQKLIEFNADYDALTGTNAADLSTIKAGFEGEWGDFEANGANDDYPLAATNSFHGLINDDTTPTDPDLAKVQAQLDKLFLRISTAMTATINAIKEYELNEEKLVVEQMPIYPKIISGLSKNMNTVPPSGAMAGIYANVDATRGVWKAPANISVNSINGLTADINDKDQGNMNVHETGKAINAIRKFTGRGTLVWGARTLDGNSNDWRYVNVRRLANMIEESVKKACMSFVFEPNVKQTWVNVKGMIDNYLTTLWGDGALAGAKPEDAFFVSVGLHETMSADDINNGRMIVKIGYAPSRPAEFIILEFVQTQQKS